MTKLSTYHSKRDFAVTAEPRGRVGKIRARAHKFVIQRHDATRLHYDLRLELDGVYKSWAVTKPPSLDPAVKRLAVEVEDHPLAYGTFEGTIPEGEYGGGTVQLWDRGIWKQQSSSPPTKDLKEGHLKFEMDGKRMKGGWALIRMRDRDMRAGRKVRHNWLLIKERDEVARPGDADALAREVTSVKTGRTLEEIASRSRKTSATSSLARKSPAEPMVLGVRITHPDKIFWPKTKENDAVTKLDLACYFESVADRILEHIAERPISIVRAPDGIDGQKFFQRHTLMGTAVPMLALRVRGEAKPYLGIKDAESLVALAQAGVIEIHPWGSKARKPDVPERIIFDLDPGEDVSFDRVIDAARELRERLTSLGFTPFVKTTGGKGMHLVIAVKGAPKKPLTWPEAKTFARALAIEIAGDSPNAYTVALSKKNRVGKVFIDYLRNDRMSTGIAPWSPRVQPGATIAAPLKWTQVKRGLDPKAFTIASVASLLRRSDPWKDLTASAKPLAPATKKLKAV